MELENRRIVGAEVRERTRGKGGKSWMALNIAVTTGLYSKGYGKLL